jgi:hypothetical protein
MEHDASYKLLFAHVHMVEDLLQGFVHEAWVREVDFTTLERVSGPRLRYALLEERQYTERELAPLRNLVAALFRLENCREPAEIERVLEGLVTWLRAPEEESLRRAFTVWLTRVLLPARLPKVPIPAVHDLVEIQTMLAERVVEWTQQWKEAGLREGRREGLQQGQLQEAQAMVLEAVRVRFGKVPRDIRAAVQRLETRDTLHGLLRQAMTCPTVETFRDALYSVQG